MSRKRAGLVAFFILLLFFGVIGRLYFVQVLQYRKFTGLKEKQYIQTVEIKPKRGTIFDTQGRELALSIDVDSVCAFPRQIEDVQGTAAKLAKVLDIDQEVIKEKLKSEKYFVWIARKIETDQAREIKSYNLKGVDFVKESKR